MPFSASHDTFSGVIIELLRPSIFQNGDENDAGTVRTRLQLTTFPTVPEEPNNPPAVRGVEGRGR